MLVPWDIDSQHRHIKSDLLYCNFTCFNELPEEGQYILASCGPQRIPYLQKITKTPFPQDAVLTNIPIRMRLI